MAFQLGFSLLSLSQFSGNQTPTYPNLVRYYDSLAKSGKVELYNMGLSDYGLPIYLCVLNGKGDSLKTFAAAKKETTVFINNGIHPGEPDGINACGMLTQDYISGKLNLDKNVIFAFILCYNVGGAMNRGTHSRANQVGPEEYGFRGNARNLDLNRDFIKMDSENAFTFARIFQALDPDLFIDTHVSNGADYQHTLTLIYPLKERQQAALRKLTVENFIPEMRENLKKLKIDVVPYVETVEDVPDKGLEAFNDLPRYAMGYASLFHCLSITTETHMLKAFEDRVRATYHYLNTSVEWVRKNRSELELSRAMARNLYNYQPFFTYNYERTDYKDSLWFKGFTYTYKKSKVTGLDRLFYDRTKPFERYVPFYNQYIAKDSVKIPAFYIVGAQEKGVLQRLKQNGILYKTVQQDSLIRLTCLRVEDFSNGNKPYEGHFLHRKIQVNEEEIEFRLKKGDVVIPTHQERRFFICSVLEPEAEDSYFAWNFFDSYVQQKEYFSSYVFEEIAEDLLKKDPILKSDFERKHAEDAKFAASQWDQLYFIYKRSPYFEPSFMRLPVFKVY